MATIVANAGAAGNWTSGAAWIGGIAPTAADDAQITVATTSITIDSGAVCRSADFNGCTGTVTHSAGVILTIGDGTAGASNIALRLASGMTYTKSNATTSAITFASTSATVQTITLAGKTTGNIIFSGVGGSWQVQDTWTSTSIVVTHNSGTLDLNGQTISWSSFASASGLTRTLTLGASPITLGLSGTAWNTSVSAGLTMTTNTATVTCTGNSATFNSGSINYNGTSLTMTGTQTTSFSGSPTLANLTRTVASGQSGGFSISGSPVMTGAFTVTGNSAIVRVLITSSVIGTVRTITVGSVSLTNVDFADITASGATPWTGTSMGNALGNTNITFDTPATQTHTASAGGNWSDVTKWTSRIPLPQDNVIIDVNTTGTITADMPRLGADITFAGFTGTADFSAIANSIYGSITLGSGMTITGTQALTIRGRSALNITSNTKQFTQAVSFSAPSSTYTLIDAFSTAGIFTVTIGTFTAGSFGITALDVLVSGGTLSSTGTITLTDTATSTIWSRTAGTLSLSSSTIVIASSSTNVRTFGGGGQTYGTLTYTVAGSTGGLDVTGANTFSTINFSDVTNARTLRFTAATTTTITSSFNVNGTSGKLMSISSITAATHTLSKSSGVVSCDYLSLTNSIATGGAAWYAGANSTNVSGNTGWMFAAPPTIFPTGNLTLMGV